MSLLSKKVPDPCPRLCQSALGDLDLLMIVLCSSEASTEILHVTCALDNDASKIIHTTSAEKTKVKQINRNIPIERVVIETHRLNAII